MKRTTALAAMLLAAPAAAEPLLTFDGTLVADDGTPLEGPVELAFAVHVGAEDAEPVWSETWPDAEVIGGQVLVPLGAMEPLPADVWAEDVLFLSVSLGGELLGAQRITAVPRAFVADAALDVRGRAIHPASVSIGDTLIIDDQGRWVGDVAGLQGPQGEAGPQ
ncbi:MAG: hypothetical protein KC613_05880, partial [Myxococcales bacterium]|nr:hypothetical protein [Myxococcales bacterium]